MVHRELSRSRRLSSVPRHSSAERHGPALNGILVVLGTVAAAGVVYLLYFLVVYSALTP
jgi:hypothetical protein